MATLIETLPTGKSRRAVIETASARAGAGATSTTRSAAAASRTHRADFVLMTFVLASGVLPTHRWPRLASERGFAGPGETHLGGDTGSGSAQTLMTPLRTMSASSASRSV